MFRAVLAYVSERFCTGGQTLTKLHGKTIKRCLRNPQRFEALVAEGNADPSVSSRTFRVSGRCDNSVQPTHQLTARLALIDTKQHMYRRIGSGPRTQPRQNELMDRFG